MVYCIWLLCINSVGITRYILVVRIAGVVFGLVPGICYLLGLIVMLIGLGQVGCAGWVWFVCVCLRFAAFVLTVDGFVVALFIVIVLIAVVYG